MATGSTTSVRIYSAIKETVMSFTASTVLATGKRAKVEHFALFNNQIEALREGNRNPIRFPAVFINFENNHNSLSAGRTDTDGIFVLHIGLESLKFDDIEVLTFVDELYAHLMFELPKKGFGNFRRSYDVLIPEYTNTLVQQQEYEYSYINDDAADEKRYRSLHPFDVGLNVHYQQ